MSDQELLQRDSEGSVKWRLTGKQAGFHFKKIKSDHLDHLPDLIAHAEDLGYVRNGSVQCVSETRQGWSGLIYIQIMEKKNP